MLVCTRVKSLQASPESSSSHLRHVGACVANERQHVGANLSPEGKTMQTKVLKLIYYPGNYVPELK